MLVGSAMVQLGLSNGGFMAGLAQSTAALSRLGDEATTMDKLKVGFGIMGIAAVIGGAAAVKMAGDFQQSTNLLITSAGESTNNIGMIRSGLLQMSVDTATSTGDLVKGMFNIESSSFHGADALLIEGVAARGAKVENADLSAVTDVLTTALHNYHESASQATDTMNSFRMAASLGKMHMDDLTAALTNVLPIASQAGVHLTDVEAALSTMSQAGDKGASAGTHLSQMLTYLLAPSSKATKALTDVGLTTQQISDEMKVSLPGTVQMITQAVGEKFPAGSAKYIAAISAIVGGNKSMKAMLELSGVSLKDFTTDANLLGPTMKANSTAVDGWSTVQGNFNFKLDAAKNAVSALFIKIGTGLLPVLGQILTAITPAITGFGNLVSSGGQMSPILSNITGMFGIMAGNFRDFGAQVGPIISGPLAQFGQLMGSLLPGFISQFLRVLDLAQLAFLDIATSASSFVGPALAILGQTFKGVQGVVETILNALEGQFLPALHNLITVIAPIIAGILNWIASSNVLGIAFNVISVVVQVVIGAISLLINILAAIINFFANTALGAAMFKAILVTLAIALGIIAIVILTVVIPAFIAWVAGAIAVGIANIIAFGPIILIVLAIIAVITVVILIITHWGQIMAWFGSVFSAIGTFVHGVLSAMGAWFGSVFSAIGTTVHNALTGIKNFFGTIFSGIGTFVSQKITDIQNFFKALPGKILAALATLGAILVAPFLWLYNHNYYVKAAVDAIILDLTNLKNLVGNIFSAIGTFIHDKLTWIQNLVGDIFSAIGTFVHDKLTWIKDTVGSIFSAIGTFFHDKLTDIKNFFGTIFSAIGTVVHDKIMALAIWLYGIWEQIKSTVGSKLAALRDIFGNIFSTIGTAVHDKITGLWNWLVSFVGGWPTEAFNWGKSLVQGIINGIGSMFSALGSTVSKLAGQFVKFLGFHSSVFGVPAEGPGSHADTWMPALIKGLIGGIQEGMPHVHAALGALMQPIGANSLSHVLVGSTISPSSASVTPTSASGASSGVQGGQIILEINGRQFAQATVNDMGDALVKHMRVRTGMRA